MRTEDSPPVNKLRTEPRGPPRISRGQILKIGAFFLPLLWYVVAHAEGKACR
jgi:hypothetical protein